MSFVGNDGYNLECLQSVGLGIMDLSYHISWQPYPALFPPFPEPQKLNLDYAKSANVSKELLQSGSLCWELLGIFSLSLQFSFRISKVEPYWEVPVSLKELRILTSRTKIHVSSIFSAISLINYWSDELPFKGSSLPTITLLTLEIREAKCLQRLGRGMTGNMFVGNTLFENLGLVGYCVIP